MQWMQEPWYKRLRHKVSKMRNQAMALAYCRIAEAGYDAKVNARKIIWVYRDKSATKDYVFGWITCDFFLKPNCHLKKAPVIMRVGLNADVASNRPHEKMVRGFGLPWHFYWAACPPILRASTSPVVVYCTAEQMYEVVDYLVDKALGLSSELDIPCRGEWTNAALPRYRRWLAHVNKIDVMQYMMDET